MLRRGVIGVLCAAILSVSASPVWAAAPEPGPATAELGTLTLGDGLEAVIGEADGSVRFGVAAGTLALGWDSRAIRTDRSGFGPGWGLPLASVGVRGGVQVFPASGGMFEVDDSHPSGLRGYPSADVRFQVAEPGAALDGRDGGPAVEYAYVLHETGGARTYFNAHGDPVARVTASDARTDWRWAEGDGHRLLAMVDPDGLATTIDWSDPSEVIVRPGANVTAPEAGSGAGGEWRIALDGGRVDRVVDPSGGSTRVGYDRAGRVAHLTTASGATTTLTWHEAPDGVARVAAVRTHDLAGTELSVREWEPVGGVGVVSGWPGVGDGSGPADDYSTVVTDGKTRVTSAFDDRQLMTGRAVSVATRSGERLVHEQSFGFPESDEPVDPLRPVKPTEISVTSVDQAGARRTVQERVAYDELGRITRRVAADGTVSTVEYDPVVPAGAVLAVGLPVLETTTAPDGLVTTTRYELGADRAAPVAIETTTAGPDVAERVTGRTELAYDAGVVVEERVFPGGDPASVPVVTAHDHHVDLTAGTRTHVQTAAAGTAIAASVASVSSLMHGGALSETDEVGATMSATYDAAGRLVAITGATGHETVRSYRTAEADGVNAVTTTTPDGVATTEERDVLGRVTRSFDNVAPDGTVSAGHERVFQTRAYPSAGVEAVTDAWGATTTTEHDAFGRPARVTLPNGLVQLTDRDDVAATVTTGVSATGALEDAEHVVTRRLDSTGRITGTSGSRADGVTVPETTAEFDGLGRQVAGSNGAVETRVSYDGAGNPVTTTTAAVRPGVHDEASGTGAVAAGELVATRRFDGFGQSLEKTLSTGEVSRSGGAREFDELGRTVVETDQKGVRTFSEYTPDGLISRTVSETGQESVFRYDERTRDLLETRVRFPGRADVITAYEYDGATGRLVAVFDPGDRVATEIRYTHDAHGNVRQVRYPDDESGTGGGRVRYEYDAHGRRTAITDVHGNRTAFSHDATGFMTSAVQTADEGRGDELSRVAYEADDHGRIVRIARGNGVVTDLTYTSVNQIATETTARGEHMLSERTYEYDPVSGNLTVRVDRTREAAGGLVAERTEYGYDTLDRLVSSVVRAGEEADALAVRANDYELDVSGAVLTERAQTAMDSTSQVTVVRDLTYSATGELIEIATTDASGATQVSTQEYDPAGNLVRGADGSTYTWDAANRQTAHRSVSGERIETTYWADGTRRQLEGDRGSSTRFFWDGTALLSEAHVGAVETPGEPSTEGSASYLLGAARHARTIAQPDGTFQVGYYGADRHGNVTEVFDGLGAITNRYAYSDYGAPLDRPGDIPGPGAEAGGDAAPGVGDLERNPFGYAGEYTHTDGSQFLRERTYQPALLSFTSEDREQLHSVYGFANANPIMMVDPSGRDAIKDWVSVGLAAYAAVAAFAGVLALATGGAALGGFGVVAMAFGIGDAVFTGLEAWAVNTDTKFMPDDVALGVGIGLAVVGTVFGVGGFMIDRRAAQEAAAAAAASTAAEKGAALERFERTALKHLGGAESGPPYVMRDHDTGTLTLIAGSSETGLSPLIARLVGGGGTGKAGVRDELVRLIAKPKHAAFRTELIAAQQALDTAIGHAAELVSETSFALIAKRIQGLEFDVVTYAGQLSTRIGDVMNSLETVTENLALVKRAWLNVRAGASFTEDVVTPFDEAYFDTDWIHQGFHDLDRY